MNRMQQKALMFLISLFILSGCNNNFIESDHSQTIQLNKDSAERLNIKLKVNYGKVNIASTSENWIDGQIDYNYDKLEPKMDYELDNQTGKVTISQPDPNIKTKKVKNNWRLNLTKERPIELYLETGAADTSLDLRDLQIDALTVKSGVGRTTIDLSGDWDKDTQVNMELGVGETTVTLPSDIGVKVISEKGIGFTNFDGFMKKNDGIYVNEAYGKSQITLTVKTEIGVGEANFIIE